MSNYTPHTPHLTLNSTFHNIHFYESRNNYNRPPHHQQLLHDPCLVRQPEAEGNAHQHRLAANPCHSCLLGYRPHRVLLHDSRQQHREPYQRRALQPDAAEDYPRGHFPHGVHHHGHHHVPHRNTPVESRCGLRADYRRSVLRVLEVTFILKGGSLPLGWAAPNLPPLAGRTPQRPLNNPSLKGTVACKKDRQSQFHFVRCYPPDFLPSNYALSPRKMGSLRRRLLGHGVPSQP